MRRYANTWAVLGDSLEMQNNPVAQGVGMPEGHGVESAKGEGSVTTGGVEEYGTGEGDGPGTWETRVSLRARTGVMGTR